MAASNEQRKAFLEELSALSVRHKLVIAGCGCCGSPFVIPMDETEVAGYAYTGGSGDYKDQLEWKKPALEGAP